MVTIVESLKTQFSKTTVFDLCAECFCNLVVERKKILSFLSEVADEAGYNGNDTCLSFFVG